MINFMPLSYDTVEEALQGVLDDIKKAGLATSPRGRKSYEILGYHFTIEDPRHRLVSLKAREMNIYYLVGNLLWVLSQSNKLDFIEYYNERGRNFSDDGDILRGAYGKRIFDFDGMNQWHQVVKELKTDPDSRRAIISIHLPQHDWSGSLDTPCTSDFQFFIRENKLHMINHMRSQSAAMVMPYDIFLMTMLHELMARELGVELGEYQHFAGSMHYYDYESPIVDKIVNDGNYNVGMDDMPPTTYDSLKPLLFLEKEIRNGAKLGRYNHTYYMEKIDNLGFDKYWKQIAYILCLKAIDYIYSKPDISGIPEPITTKNVLINKLDFCYQQFFK